MKNLNKLKISFIITVMFAFTLINIINNNNWVGYLLSTVIIPLITWLIIEIYLFLKNSKILKNK